MNVLRQSLARPFSGAEPYAIFRAPSPEPFIGTALHDGHALRPEVARAIRLDAAERLREEDPSTVHFARLFATRAVGQRSRFEVDLNRPAGECVYDGPASAWGLEVWGQPLSAAVRRRSQAIHESFYRDVADLLDGIVQRHGAFVVYDLHSYNHRRNGPDAPPEPQAENPDINFGTENIDRSIWGPLLDGMTATLREQKVQGRPLDVRENVKFKGAWFPQWVRQRYGARGCSIAIEIKKTYMDEWSGELYPAVLEQLRHALQATLPGMRSAFRRVQTAIRRAA